MSIRTASCLLLVALAFALPSRAVAQLSVSGKVVTYRTLDLDSHEELQQSRSWQISDTHGARELTETTYPSGTRVLSECAFADGFARPAATFRSVMQGPNGELERSDFDTLDPRYYPFLAEPITAHMQPGSCVSRSALDLPRLVRGDQVETWIWSDSGLIGVNLQKEANERLTVPAGSFDSVRIRIDLDLSKIFPRVPALFLTLFKPHFTIWITPAEPYYVLKTIGFGAVGGRSHKNTGTELTSIGELTANDSHPQDALEQVDSVGSQPSLTPINSGQWSQGNRTGHLTLSSATTPDGELLVAHVRFSNGLATESRTLVDRGASPITAYLDDRSFATSGAIVRKHVLFFRKAAFPDDPKKDLPADLYGADTTLGAILPRLLPETTGETSFHVMDFSGQLSELTIDRDGFMAVALGSDDARAIHAKLNPIVDIPILLRPLAYFFMPSFDAYFDADSPHRMLKFEGPVGPPGVPNATMLADEKVSGSVEGSPAGSAAPR